MRDTRNRPLRPSDGDFKNRVNGRSHAARYAAEEAERTQVKATVGERGAGGGAGGKGVEKEDLRDGGEAPRWGRGTFSPSFCTRLPLHSAPHRPSVPDPLPVRSENASSPVYTGARRPRAAGGRPFVATLLTYTSDCS